MNGLATFQIYQSLRLHFTQDNYDATKYNFKTRVNENSFMARKDRYTFEKLGKAYTDRNDLIQFFVSNFTKHNVYIRNMNQDCHGNRLGWLESMRYNFEQEIKQFEDMKFDDMCLLNNESNTFMGAYTSHKITLETLTIVDILTGFLKEYHKGFDPLGLLHENVMMVKKYKSFISLSKEQVGGCRKTILKQFS